MDISEFLTHYDGHPPYLNLTTEVATGEDDTLRHEIMWVYPMGMSVWTYDKATGERVHTTKIDLQAMINHVINVEVPVNMPEQVTP